jgi:hypothetical protein
VFLHHLDGDVVYVTLTSSQDCAPGEKEGKVNNKPSEFSDAATRMLLARYQEMKDRFRNPKIKRSILWKEMAGKMNEYGYAFTEQSVERKFRNMKSHFLKIRDNNTKTGRGRKSWQYYDMMEDLFENDACVHPVLHVSSMVRV